MTWFIALFKFAGEKTAGPISNSNLVLYAGFFLGAFYALGFLGVFTSQRLDRYMLRVRIALSNIEEGEAAKSDV